MRQGKEPHFTILWIAIAVLYINQMIMAYQYCREVKDIHSQIQDLQEQNLENEEQIINSVEKISEFLKEFESVLPSC